MLFTDDSQMNLFPAYSYRNLADSRIFFVRNKTNLVISLFPIVESLIKHDYVDVPIYSSFIFVS